MSATISEKAVICTICRDAAAYLPEMISQIENIGSLFEDYRVVVYENNSEDDTPSQLYRWKKANSKIVVMTEFLSYADKINMIINCADGFSSTEQRAIARNKALVGALSHFGEEFSYILCIDSNVKLESPEEIVKTFQESRDWDAVFAYKTDVKGNFNDWMSFRNEMIPFGPELMGDSWYLEKRKFSLTECDPWAPVYSAFGGCAIYRRCAVQNCRYNGLVSSFLEQAARKWFFEGLDRQSCFIYQYLKGLETIDKIIYLESPQPNSPKLTQEKCGIAISKEPLLLVWRTHGSSYQYPEVSEHVSLHASMYCSQYRRLFINPRLRCVGRDSHYEIHPNQD